LKVYFLRHTQTASCLTGVDCGSSQKHSLIPFHHKSDTFGDKPDKEDKEDKEEDLYQEFCEMV